MKLRRATLALEVGRDLLFAILTCAATVVIVLSVQLRLTEEALREHSLEGVARHLDSQLKPAPDGTASLPPAAAGSRSGAGYSALLFDAGGRVLFRRPADLADGLAERLWPEASGTAPPNSASGLKYFHLLSGEQHFAGVALRTAGSGQDRILVVFKDENAPDVLIDDIVSEFPYRSLVTLLPVFGVLLLASGWIIWRRTRPIAAAAEIARTIGPHTSNTRLPENDLPADLLLIVRSVNGALARLDKAAEAQREFFRHAAHHLRTPLTVLMARAMTVGNSKTARQLRTDVEAVARVVTQLLQLNEIDGLPEAAQQAATDLAAVAEAARIASGARAAKRGCPIEIVAPDQPVLVFGDPNFIEIALRYLLDNAIEHSPEGDCIVLQVGTGGAVEVADHGPGIAEPLQEKIFEPFWSGDPEGMHAGLGLTIASRIAERFGGSVELTQNPAKGAVFRLQFRLATTPLARFEPAVLAAAAPQGWRHDADRGASPQPAPTRPA